MDLLLECHDRIRRFTRMAVWLANAHDAPLGAVKETAEATLRYFTEALPRHSADEDLSIAPRLLQGRPPEELRDALAAMTRQHGELEKTFDTLIPMWRTIADDPASLAAHAADMQRPLEQLRSQWDVHLHLEETIVFPAIRARLSPRVLAEVLREMRERRR